MRGLTLFMLCLCLWLPFAALAQSDDTDRGFVAGLLEDALSGDDRNVRVEGFEGALSSRATIKKITVADTDGIWLTLSDISMTWSRRALLSGVVDIDEIVVGKLVLPRRPVPSKEPLRPEASGGFTLPNLPVAIDLKKLKVTRGELGAPLFGEAAVLAFAGSAQLANGSGAAKLDVQRLDEKGRLSFEAKYGAGTEKLALALDLNEPENGIAANLLRLPGVPPLELTIKGEGPVDDFTADLRLVTDGLERLTGRATLRGTKEGGRAFDARLGGDLAPVLAPKYRDFLGRDVRLTTRGERRPDGTLVLDALALRSAALALEGHATFDPEGWPAVLDLEGDILPPDGKRVILPLPGPTTSVSGASVILAFNAEAGNAYSFLTDAHNVHRESDRVERLALSMRGAIARETAEISGAVSFEASGLAPASAALARAVGETVNGVFDFDWRSDAPVLLRNISLQGADYGLSGEFRIAKAEDALDANLRPDVTLKAQDLSRFSALSGLTLRGAAELQISGEVQPVSGVFDLSIQGSTDGLSTGIDRLDPMLAGIGRLAGKFSRDTRGLRADQVIIRSDLARITASGILAEGASTGRATFALTDVAPIVSQLSGAAQVTVLAEQQGEVWQITTTGQLPGATQAEFVGQLRGDGQETLTASGRVKADIGRLASFAQLVGMPLSGAATVEAEGQGDVLARSFALSARGATRGLSLGAPLLRPFLKGRVDLRAALARNPEGVTNIETLSVSGAGLDAELTGKIGGGQDLLTYDVSVANLGVLIPELPGAASLIGRAQRGAGSWQVAATGQGPGEIRVKADGTVAPNGRQVDLALTGRAPLALANPYLSEQSLSGRGTFALNVKGPPNLSSLSGVLRTNDARLVWPAQSVVIAPITGTASLSGARAEVDIDARLQSGGRITVTGPIGLIAPYMADLQVRLRDGLLREEDLFEANLEGGFTVTGPLQGGARLGGDVDVQRVELRLPNLSPSYSALEGLDHRNLPGDVRQTLEFADLLGASQRSAAAPDFPINLTLRAPSRVFVRGRGLDAELGGVLRLRGTTNSVVPQGQFDLIRGRLDLLGRRLTLTEGAVWLRGSFDPVIRFAASTSVEDVDITLLLEGEASTPELTVTSTPDLPQEEALSLFLFGRDPTRISALQAIQLAAALRTLSGQGGLGLTESLRSSLGVDDLDLSTDAEGNTQASVGKYISDRVYTDISVNREGRSQIQLNLDVSPNVSVRGRVTSDGETGLGIFYERNY